MCKNPGCLGVLLNIGRKSVCTVCRQITTAPRVKHRERRKTDLTDQQVIAMLETALVRNKEHFVILGLLASGFRRSEISGGDDNGVTLPGLQVKDVHPDEEYVWVHGKNDKEIQQPVPRMILEAAIRLGSREEKLIPWVTSHVVGDIVKSYASLTGLPDAELVTSHRLRHWFSRRVKEHGGTKPDVAGLVEWCDVMRHSRKGLGQVTTLSFYSGPMTPFERRRDVVRAAMQGILDQLDSRPASQNDILALRISRNSNLLRSSKSPERETSQSYDNKNTPPSGSSSDVDSKPGLDSNVDSNPRLEDPAQSAPVETSPSCEWPKGCSEPATVHFSVGWFCEVHSHDPFGEYFTPPTASAPVDPDDQAIPATPAPPAADPFTEEENPEAEPIDQKHVTPIHGEVVTGANGESFPTLSALLAAHGYGDRSPGAEGHSCQTKGCSKPAFDKTTIMGGEGRLFWLCRECYRLATR